MEFEFEDVWDPFYDEWFEPIPVGPITPYPENFVTVSITGNNMNDPQFDDPTDDDSAGSGGFWESLTNAFGSAAGSVLNAAGNAAGQVINRAGNTASNAINTAAGVQQPAQVNTAAQQQKMMLFAAGAVALVAVLYFANRSK